MAQPAPPSPNDSFLDIATNNWLTANQGLDRLPRIPERQQQRRLAIPLGDPTSVPADLLPNGTTIPQVAAEAGESARNMACNPGVPLCDLSYCSFWCAGPFSDSAGQRIQRLHRTGSTLRTGRLPKQRSTFRCRKQRHRWPRSSAAVRVSPASPLLLNRIRAAPAGGMILRRPGCPASPTRSMSTHPVGLRNA